MITRARDKFRFIPDYALTLVKRAVLSVRPGLRAYEIGIKNFGQMDERFYRGARPRKNDYRALADIRISTVIDLREKPDCHEQRTVEELGMRYVNIPMTDTDYPDSKQIDAFLTLANEPRTGRFFVHCAGGRHRTGVIGAVYRLTVNRWNFDQVYSEMESYDFYTRWGHGPLKKFVQDYARKLEGEQEGIMSGITL